MRNLEPRFYVDPALFERERTAIFARAWNYAGPASAVEQPGTYVSVDVAGTKVVAVRGADGTLRAFRNVCRHRGATLLAVGTGTCGTLRCPYHHWVFDDRGALVAAPHFGDDPDFRLDDWPLEPAHVDQWRGLLFVALDPVESRALPPDVMDQTFTPVVRAIEGAVASGLLPGDTDVPEAKHQLVGFVIMSAIDPDCVMDDALADRVVDLFVAGRTGREGRS